LRTEGKVADLKDKLANLAIKGDHIFGMDFRNVVGITSNLHVEDGILKSVIGMHKWTKMNCCSVA